MVGWNEAWRGGIPETTVPPEVHSLSLRLVDEVEFMVEVSFRTDGRRNYGTDNGRGGVVRTEGLRRGERKKRHRV